MIYIEEYARLISKRLELIGLYNRWTTEPVIGKPDSIKIIKYVFEVKDQTPVFVAFELEGCHDLNIVPRLTYDIISNVISHLEDRSKH